MPTMPSQRKASRASTRNGWYLYADNHGDVSRENLNKVLVEMGLDPVSKRSYAHYASIYGTGYRGDYIPINHFDVLKQYGAWPPNGKLKK